MITPQKAAAQHRAAADKLDALMTDSTPGPWHANVTEIYGDVSRPIQWVSSTWRRAPSETRGNGDAAYIATMNPDVGHRLAVLLRFNANIIETVSPDRLEMWAAEMAVAQAILGTEDTP